jgi:hypothetical protein
MDTMYKIKPAVKTQQFLLLRYLVQYVSQLDVSAYFLGHHQVVSA